MNKNNNQKNNFTNRNERQMVNTNKTNSPSANQSLISTLPKEDLSEIEIEGLVWMREEEKLARDVYRTLYETWGLRTFDNISSSENTHTLAVKELLDRYEIIDPVTDDATGEFSIPEIQKLYTDLVTQGKVSLVDALRVGASIEDLDIKDLHEWLTKTDNQDITLVYENLLRGSQNHMRSFVKQLENNGSSYTAQYLSQTEIDSILAGEQQQGSHAGQQGAGQGKGGPGRNR